MGARPARVMTLRMASGVVAISTSRSGWEQRGHVVASTRPRVKKSSALDLFTRDHEQGPERAGAVQGTFEQICPRMPSRSGGLSGGMGVGSWSPGLFEGFWELEGEGELLSRRGQ